MNMKLHEDQLRELNKSDKIMYILERYRLEPRCSLGNARTWMVAFDKSTGLYVKAVDEGSNRAYKRFFDSQEAFKWLLKNYSSII